MRISTVTLAYCIIYYGPSVRNSPMAQTPPCHLPNIPGVTSPGALIEDSKVEVNNLNNLNNHDRKHAVGDEAQFEMDI